MKILLIISFAALFGSCASSQTLPTDSLQTSIRNLQKQVAQLQAQVAVISQIHVVTFDTASFIVQNIDSLHQHIYLKPVTATVDLSTINSEIAALQNKLAALKAISVTTTTIQ